MTAPLNSESTIRPGELVGGHTAGYWAAKARECPKCGALPHGWCRTPSGVKSGTLHSARYASQAGESA